MRRLLLLAIVALSLTTIGCESLMDFFNVPSDSNTADQRDIYKAKTGNYPN